MTENPPVLAAEDAADLEIISARLQDAVARVDDLVWLPKSRRFAALFNRFKWETAEQRGGKGDNLRTRSGLHFDSVLSAQSVLIHRGAPDAVLSLLTINFTPNAAEDPGGIVELLFAGGGKIRLEVECIDAGLTDIGGEWAARGRPKHETEEG
ncbi:MAG TPA: DUF2948 family protein [Rhizomicrobium sp.]|jgi:hypothetical protein|nr:DUF2948 family protein [Rhizomicrobium sp.]